MNILTINEVLTGSMAAEYGPLPMIPLPQDEDLLTKFIRQMGALLADKGIYRRDTVIVLPDAKIARLNILEPEVFCSWAQEHVVNYKMRHNKNGEPFKIYKDMPTEIAKKTILSPRFREYVPEIEEVLPIPMPERMVNCSFKISDPGFLNGKFTFAFETQKNHSKIECPYKAMTLKESTDYLRSILREFPFGDWKVVTPLDCDGGTGEPIKQSRSQAIQIAAMLSMFTMNIIPKGSNRMGFIYNANSQRTGKTLLAKLAIMPVCGQFKAQPWKTKEEELNKILDSQIIEGSIYTCFDNARGYVSSQTLEGLMTAPQWTGRVLGKTQMFTAENRMNLFITGNDCTVSPDMAHRCLMCDLFVEEVDVQDRQVENLIDEVWLTNKENRRNILSALWGLVRSWHESGEPSASSFGYKPKLGFERWGEIIGGIVGHSGFGNPFEKVELETAGDSEDRNIRKLITRMRDESLENEDECGSKKYIFQELVDFCYEDGLFNWILDGKQTDRGYELNKSSKSIFSNIIKKYFPTTYNGPKKPTKPPRKFSVSYGALINKCSGERKDPVDAIHYVGSTGDNRHKRYYIEWMPAS